MSSLMYICISLNLYTIVHNDTYDDDDDYDDDNDDDDDDYAF